MNTDLKNRLENWKFEDAVKCLYGESEKVKNLTQNLAELFGNSGWFEGAMGRLIEKVVEDLINFN